LQDNTLQSEEIKDKGYDYLLNMTYKSHTKEKMNKLKELIESLEIKIKNLNSKSEGTLWNEELDEFLAEYKTFCKNRIK